MDATNLAMKHTVCERGLIEVFGSWNTKLQG